MASVASVAATQTTARSTAATTGTTEATGSAASPSANAFQTGAASSFGVPAGAAVVAFLGAFL